MPKVSGRRLTITVDLFAVAAVFVGAALAVAPRLSKGQVTVGDLEHRFGPPRYSQGVEELVIRDFFNDRQFGVFVDVGAGHYMNGSNTYFLETNLNWRGVAIDAIADYADDYREHRQHTLFFPLFVSDHSDALADFFFVPNHRTLSSGSAQAVAGEHVERRQVRTVRLDDLLGANSVTTIDFLSMDIELGEPAALAGFDIERFRPELVCIEAHPPVRDQLSSYFEAHHYRQLAKYESIDDRNWYLVRE